MEDNKNKTKVDLMYDDLFEQGYLEKDRDTFNKFFYAPGEQGYKNRKALYDDLHEQGYLESPTYEDFANGIGLHAVGNAPSSSQVPKQNSPVIQNTGVVGGVAGGITPGSYAQEFAAKNQGFGGENPGRTDLVESLNKYGESLKTAPEKVEEKPQGNVFGGGASNGGSGTKGSWSDGQSVTTSDGKKLRMARQEELYVDDKGKPALGYSKEDAQEIERSELYYPLMRNDSINVRNTEAFRKGWLTAPQYEKNRKYNEAQAAGYKAQGEKFKNLTDQQLVQAMREEEKKLDGSTSPEALQASMNVTYIETLMAAREWGLGDVAGLNANPHMVDYHMARDYYNKNGLVDKYEKNMLTGRDDNPLLIRGWELIEEQYAKDEAEGNHHKSSYYRNLPFHDPKFAEEFGAYITARIKATGERWNDAVKDAIDDFEAAAEEDRVGKKHSEEYLGSANREQVDQLSSDINSSLEKRREELYKKEESLPWTAKVDPEMNRIRQIDILNDPEYGDYVWAQRALNDAKEIIAAFDANKLDDGLVGFFSGAVRGMVDSIGDISTWDGGISDLLSAQRLNSALEKSKKGKPLTNSEKALLEATSLKMATAAIFKEVGKGYKAGKVTGESLPFMVEMALNPLSKSGNAIAKGLAKYAKKHFGKYLEKMVMKLGRSSAGKIASKIIGSGATKKAGKVAARVVGDIAAAGGMSATSGVGHSLANTIGYHSGDVQYQQGAGGKTHFGGVMGGDDWVTATLKGFTATTIENASEMWGEYFKPVTNFLSSVGGKTLEKMHLGRINKWLSDLNSTEMARLVGDFRKQTKWDGSIAEYFEEVAGNIANALTVKDMNFALTDKNGKFSLKEEHSVFNAQDNLDTFLGVSLMSGAMSTAKIVGYKTPTYRAKQDVKRYGDMAKRIFGNRGNDWSTIANLIQDNSEEARKQLVVDLMQSGKYSKREKQIALQYAGAVYKSMGMDLGESKQKRSAGDQEASDAYGRGYNMANLENISETSGVYNQLRAQMEQEYGTEFLSKMDENPGTVYGWLRSGEVKEEDAQKVLNYLNAKMAYDGAMDRLNDDDAAAKAAAEAHVDDTIHTEENGGDGQIHPVALKGREGDFFVVSGNVATDNEGNVDVNASDTDIVVVDSDGKRIMTHAKDIAQVGDAIDPEAAKADAVAQIDGATQEVINGEKSGESGENLEDVDSTEESVESEEVAAPDGATQQGTQAPLPVTEYNPDDLVTVMVDGRQVDGIITQGLDSDGNVTIHFEEPINGQQNWQMTPEQLSQEAVSYTSRDGVKIDRSSEVGSKKEEVAEQAAPSASVSEENTQQQQAVQAFADGYFGEGNVPEGWVQTMVDNPAVFNSFVGEVEKVAAVSPDSDAARAMAAYQQTLGSTETPAAPMEEEQPTANGELDVQTGETPQTSNAPVAEAPQQALAQPSLPIGEDGNADFSNATPQEAHDYIYNDPELDEDEANQTVQNYADSAAEELAKAQAALDELKATPAPQMKDYGRDTAGYKRDRNARNEAIAQAQAAVDAAQRDVDLWNGVQAQHMMNRAAANAAANREENPAAPAQTQPAAEPTEGTQEPSVPQSEENGPVASTTPSSSEEERGESEEAPAAEQPTTTADERIENARIARLIQRAEQLAATCGIPVRICKSEDEIPARYKKAFETAKGKGKKRSFVNGFFFHKKTANGELNEIVLYIPDIAANGGMWRLERTFLHEAVAHGGLRALFENAQDGIQTFNDLCDKVWNEVMPSGEKRDKRDYVLKNKYGAERYEEIKKQYRKEGKSLDDLMTDALKREAADEYMAHLAEDGTDKTLLEKVIQAVRDALRKIKLIDKKFNDMDIVDLLAASRRNLTEMDKQILNQDVADELDRLALAGEDNGGSTLMSTTSIMEGGGLEVSREVVDKDGKVTKEPLVDEEGNLVARYNGKEYSAKNPITADDLREGDVEGNEATVLQMLINDAKGAKNITDEQAAKIYQNYADMINLFLKCGSAENGGADTVMENWEWLGDTVFRAVAANGDAQYSYSMDITKVCKKNEAVIKSISALQLREGRGATPSEIVEIYRDTHAEGYQVPCPVCYVFTRYIRNGKYASAAITGMEEYGEHLPGGKSPWTLKQWRDELNRLDRTMNPDSKQKCTAAEKAQAKRFKKQLDEANDITVYYEDRVNALSFLLTSKFTSEARKKEILEELRIIDAQYKAAVNIIARQSLTNWIKTFAIQEKEGKWTMREDAKKPEDMDDFRINALDLRLTSNTILNYPAIQRLRKSGGSAAGKEISFESDNRLGEVVSGLGINKSNLNTYSNVYEEVLKAPNEKERKKLRKKATERFQAASEYAQQQTLRGGQRMWSWSDNIERLSPDIAINIMQLQLLGGAMQTYSKQLEGIKLAAQMGAYVNGSLMAKDNGWEEVKDSECYERDGELWLKKDKYDVVNEPRVGKRPRKRKRIIAAKDAHVYQAEDGRKYVLVYDDIVGVDPFGNEHDGERKKGLFQLNKELDRAGNILVGMNDLHVRAAMADPAIFFIIPWHASGAHNHILNEMLEILGQRMTERLDYTVMQEEKNMLERNKDTKKLPEVTQRLRDLWEEGRQWAKQNKWKSGMEVDSNGSEITEDQYVYRSLRGLIFDGSIFEAMPTEEQYQEAVEIVTNMQATVDELNARNEAWKAKSPEYKKSPEGKAEKKEIDDARTKANKAYKPAVHTIELHDGLIDWRDSSVNADNAEWQAQHPKRINVEEARRIIEADEFLKQVYDRVSKTPGQKMTSGDNTYIYPYEYWQETDAKGKPADIKDADINGKRYVEYCRRMGYKPKFSGNWKTADVEKQNQGNFVHDPGYWKLLIDRRMYDRNGKYQWLDPVDSDNFDTALVDPRETHKEFHVTTVADDKAADEIAQKVFERLSTRTESGFAAADYNKPLGKIMDEYDAALAAGVQNGKIKLTAAEESMVERMKAATVEAAEESGVMFSTSPSEERTLMGVHNITADKLKSAIGLGGLANPSMAVVDTKHGGFSNFGEISLIPGRDLIDKKTGKNAGTFTADAYTPTFPKVLTRLPNGEEEKVRTWFEERGVPAEIVSWAMKEYGKDPSSQDKVPSFMRDHFAGQIPENAMGLAFLIEHGLADDIMVYHCPGLFSDEATIIGYHPSLDIRAFKDLYATDEDFRKRVSESAKLYFEREVYAKKHKAPKSWTSDFDRWLDSRDEWLSELYANGELSPKDAWNWYKRSLKKWNESNHSLDLGRTLGEVKSRIEQGTTLEDYKVWRNTQLQELGAGEYVQNGETYEPLSLDSASRAMRNKKLTGSNGVSAVLSPGIIRARLMGAINTLEEIRDSKDRIVSQEDFKDLSEATSKKTDYWLRRFNDDEDVLVSALSSKNLKEWSDANGFKLDAYDIKDLANLRDALLVLPTEYFETKFERPVMLNEFEAAVVPNDVDSEIREALEAEGLDVREYDPEVAGDRERVTLEAAQDSGKVMFSTSPTFYSNAGKAVENIKQNKATAEQWKAMLTKAGGIKAGEDKWMGLSTWLDENKGKSLAKDEVLQFVRDNGIQMEETEYGDLNDSPRFQELKKEYREVYNSVDDIYKKYAKRFADYVGKMESKYNDDYYSQMTPQEKQIYNRLSIDQELFDPNIYDESTIAMREMANRYGDDFDIAFYGLDSSLGIEDEEAAASIIGDMQAINGTRIDYTTEGLKNLREIAFVVPNVEPYQEGDEVHFGPENQGKAVMWVRFGETTDADGKRVLVIDEIQSNRHQDAREKGYRTEESRLARAQKIAEAKAEWEAAKKARSDYWYSLPIENRKYPTKENLAYDKILEEEVADKLDKYFQANNSIDKTIPAAPFEKNWHEVAMKRMLRLAAEEGFDKVAWTTGEQQAERYNLGGKVGWIQRGNDYGENPEQIFIEMNGSVRDVEVDENGNVVDASHALNAAIGKPLSEVIGKELADKVLSSKPGINGRLSGGDLRIGGEGMKGFYDNILPRFMDKYGKRWGVKTGTVELPNVEEAGRTMHSVDVTPEMKESVMQGQPLFSTTYSLGVPYQGTKGKIARSLMEKLPGGRRFVDLFAGGGAMTHAAMLSGKYDEYHMNDVNPIGVELFMQGLRGEWDDYNRTSMTPEEFKQIKGTPEAIPWSVLGLGRNLVKGGKPDYINRVKRLGQLKDQADKVSNSFEDYRNVEIRPGDVVYADIPYENTDTYNYGKGRKFDKKAFCDWAQAQDFPVFVSESVMPEGWVEIASESMKTINPKKKRVEKLWVQEKFADNYREKVESDNAAEPSYEANNLRFSVLDPERDADLIAELDGQEYVTVYRTMAKVNGEYYPPMDSRDHDNPEKLRNPEKLGQYTQSEERPDLAYPEEYTDKKTGKKKTRWKFNLRKSNGKSVDGVAYNPYMHTSDSALNDQFSEAQDRDDLVVVECRVPVSELDPNSYHAEKALDPVGWKPWKAGPIVSKMTGKRNLLLSRWVKPVKELSWSEVADKVSKQLGDQFDVLPSNTFSKGLRAELEKRGYKFIETDNKGIIKEGLYKGVTWSDRYYDIHPELDKRSNKKAKRDKVAEAKARNAETVRFSTSEAVPVEAPKASEELVKFEKENPSYITLEERLKELNNLYLAGDMNALAERRDISREDAEYWNKEMARDLKRGWTKSSSRVKKDSAFAEQATKVAEHAERLINDYVKDRDNMSDWGIEDGQKVSIDELDKMFKDHNTDEVNGELWDKVIATSKKLGADIKFKSLEKKYGGAVLGNRVRYRTDFFNEPTYTDAYKCHVMLHEMIHHATVYAMEKPWRLDKAQQEAVKKLLGVFKEIKDDPDFADEYGTKDEYEMVAELSKPEFRAKLQEKGLWRRIIDGILEIFGFERDDAVGTTAYAEAMDALENLLANPDIEAYQRHSDWALKGMSHFAEVESEGVMFSTTAAVDTLKDDERVYNDLLGKVFSGVSNGTRRGIVETAMRDMGNDFGAATESWLMGLADDGKFAQVPEDDWRKVKDALSNTLRDNGVEGAMTDNEARYVLWKAGQIEDGVFSMAEDIVMQDRLLPNAQFTMHNSQSTPDDLRFSVTPRDRAIARDQYERYMRSGRLQWVEAMQDSMLGLKKLMQAIMGERWTRIEDVAMYENPYIAENLMSSVTAAQQQAFYTEFMKPLLKEVGKLCKGGKKAREQAREDLTNYLMAKHGLERNQVLADRDAQETAQAGGNYQDAYAENRERDYSGLTALTGESDVHAAEAKAQQMVDDYEAQHDTTELWNKINAATQVTLEKQYKSGMLSYAEYQRISGMFDYYVPLRGWEETTSDQVYGYLTSKAGPFLGGGIVKRAEGRTSKADDPIATIAQMGDDSIRTGNRNLMKQRFLNFVQNHPSDLVSVSDLWLKYDDVTDEWVPVFADIDPNDSPEVVEQKIQDFEQRMQDLANQEPDKYKHGREAANIPYRVIPGMEKEHQVLVKRNGQTWVLTINGDPRAAQALNGLTNPDVQMKGEWASLIKGAEWVNRTLSALYTTLSPAFIVSNFLRDTGYSNTMVWIRESPNYALRFNANYLKLNPGTLRWLLGKWEEGTLDESKPLQKHFKEFMLNGGETGFAMVKDLEKYKESMLNEVKDINSKNFARKSMKVLGSQYELLGRSIENCARFAAYMTSREMGRSAERAAYDAKEISVNFNKKGSGGKMLDHYNRFSLPWFGALVSGLARSLYTFWNAGVQGMTNAGRAVKRHPVKAAMLGVGPLYAAGFLAPILAQLMGAGGDGDDDKNAYYNLPEYVRRSNLCIWLGDAWLTIPLPIEFRSIYGMGELTYGVISGNERYSDEELAMQIAGQFSQLLPIDMLEGGGGFHPFIPTLFKPLVEAEQNKSWSGLPIYRDSEWNKDEPEYTKAFSNVNEWIVSGAEWLNAKTGGDEFKKGWIDLNPAKIEYMLKGYLGGIYTTIDEVRRAAETAIGKRDFEWRNIPLANRVIKQGDERTESKKLRDEYFKYKEDYEETKRLINKYKNAEDTDLFDYAKKLDLMNNSKEYGRYLIFEKYATMLEAYQKAKKGASGEVLKKIEEDEKQLMRQLVDEMHNFEDGKTTVDDRPKLSKKDRSEDYGYMYNKLRTYVDINEDALLDSALKRATAAGDKGLVSAIKSIKRSIGEMKKGLGHGKDEEVMNSIREMRNSVLRSFGIIGGEEEAPEPEEQWTEEPEEDFGDEVEEPEMIEEPIEEPYPDDEDDDEDYI